MPVTNEHLARVRCGEILHLQTPQEFAPLFRLLTGRLEAESGAAAPFPLAFTDLAWEQLEPALASVVRELDCTREHYRLLAQTLLQSGVSRKEGLLHITL